MELLQALQEDQARRAEGLALIEQGEALIAKGKELIKGFGVIEGGQPKVQTRVVEGQYRKDVISRIVELFHRNNNTPLSPKEMADALGYNDPKQRQSVYTPLNREMKKGSNARFVIVGKGQYKLAPAALRNGTRG